MYTASQFSYNSSRLRAIIGIWNLLQNKIFSPILGLYTAEMTALFTFSDSGTKRDAMLPGGKLTILKLDTKTKIKIKNTSIHTLTRAYAMK